MASRKVTVTMARPDTAERSGNVVRRQVGTPSCRIRKTADTQSRSGTYLVDSCMLLLLLMFFQYVVLGKWDHERVRQ